MMPLSCLTISRVVHLRTRSDHFFFNKDLLKQYRDKRGAAKDDVPGAAYFNKIDDFIDDHYEFGELYMEYKKET